MRPHHPIALVSILRRVLSTRGQVAARASTFSSIVLPCSLDLTMAAFVSAAVTPSLTRIAPSSVSASRSYGSWAPVSVVAARVAPAAAAPTMTFEAGVFERANPYAEELKRTANYIARNGKGIMASDESNSTTGKRLAMVDLENTETNRRRWRELLYTAPDLGQYISGCIMYVLFVVASSIAYWLG